MMERQVSTSAQFGLSLRLLRKERGLSLGDLARLVNYSSSHLSRVETGKKRAAEGLARRCDEVLEAEGGLLDLLVRPPRRQKGRTNPAQLPRSVADFTGRADVLAELDATLAEVDRQRDGQAVVTVVDGAAGVGKTATVVYWGHRVRASFPDGVLFADLQGFGPGQRSASIQEVLRSFLTALGAPSESLSMELQHLAAGYRSMLMGKRLLIVLDNALSAEQVRPLLPASSGCMTVITSRSRLAGLVARDGAYRVTVPLLTEAEYDGLLARLAGAALPGKVNAICEYRYLPLTVRIAVERMETVGGIEMYERCDPDALLQYLCAINDETSNLYTVLSWSYRSLRPEAARGLRVLGSRSGTTVTVSEAAKILGTDVVNARKVLDSLTDIHLLEHVSRNEYHFEGIVKAFARECARREGYLAARAG